MAMHQRTADNAGAILAAAAATPTDQLLSVLGIVGPVLGGVAGVFAVFVTVIRMRSDGKLSREQLFQARQDKALEAADEKEQGLLNRLEAMQAQLNAQGRLIAQMVMAWPPGHPMPRPSDADLELLDLNVPFPPHPQNTETPA